MAIRMRRGNEADFDPSKMLPGEWAVSTDTKYVRMCFSPGIVLRMATYEAFESDMAEIRNILSQCQNIQTAVKLIQQNVTNSELVIENYVKEAKQYRDEAEQFRNEASMFAPEGYEDLVKNVSDNTVKIDTIIEKAELNIKNNAKGSNIHLTDSAESNVVSLELYGKTEQNETPSPNNPQEIKSVKGKNLLDCRGLTEKTDNGGTFTPVKDENGNLLYVEVKGTFTNVTNYVIASLNDLKTNYTNLIGKDIILSGTSGDVEVNWKGLTTEGIGATSGIVGDFTTRTNESSNRIRIVVGANKTVNEKIYPMIRLASITDDTYVPYGLLRIKTHGINQFDISAPTKENEILNSDGTFSTNGGFNSYRLKLTDTITISYEKDVNFDVLRYGLEIDGVITRYTISGTELTIQKDSADAVWISIGKTNAQKNIMINTGTIALPYQPYQSSEITLSEPLELNGFNGVYDVVTSEGVTRRFAEVVFDGSSDEYWERQFTNTTGVWSFRTQYIRSLVLPNASRMWCSHYKNVGASNIWSKIEGCCIDGDGWFVIYDEKFISATADDFKAHLVENPMTVVYELATPTTEELKTDFTALKTFYPETHVSNDADCDMSITYTADAKNYIDNKIALLTTAIYNNI